MYKNHLILIIIVLIYFTCCGSSLLKQILSCNNAKLMSFKEYLQEFNIELVHQCSEAGTQKMAEQMKLSAKGMNALQGIRVLMILYRKENIY